MLTDDEILDRILAREGGFVHHPADPGKATHYGITQATLSAWRGQEVTPEDVRALTEPEARAIYRQWYLEPFRGEPEAIREHVIDIAVHAGPTRARYLARLSDGHPTRLVAERLRYFARLVRSKPTLAVFLPGWVERALSFLPVEED